MKKIFLLALLLLIAVPIHAATYSTTFDVAENPISEGGNWVNGGTTGLEWHDVRTQITPRKLAYGVQGLGDVNYSDSTAVLTGTWVSNQEAQATIYKGTVVDDEWPEVELRLRSTLSAGVNKGYEICYSIQASNPYLSIVRWDGALGDYHYLFDQSGSTYAIANGDIVRATIVGNTITAYINGVQKAQVTDTGAYGTPYTTGNPGMGFYIECGAACNTVANAFGFTAFSAFDSAYAANLSVTITGNGSGTVTSAPTGISCSTGTCSYSFTIPQTMVLIVAPSSGHTVSWTAGPCIGSTSNTCTFNMSAATSATVNLTAPSSSTSYWVSNNGNAPTWSACMSATPLSGTSACSLGMANANASAGQTVYLRGGTYTITSSAINPSNNGTSATNRITFRNYNNEDVIFDATSATSATDGLELTGRSWVYVTGSSGHPIKFKKFTRPLSIVQSANSNEVAYCWFDGKGVGERYQGGAWIGSTTSFATNTTPSFYNYIHHCTFSRYGGKGPPPAGTYDGSHWFAIGKENDTSPSDNSGFNVLENNEFWGSGHSVLIVNGRYNVIRNNYMHHEPWEDPPGSGYFAGYHVMQLQGNEEVSGFNLIEGNIMAFGSENYAPGNWGGHGMKLNSHSNIIRYNDFIGNWLSGIACFNYPIQQASWYSSYCYDNSIYNNTFFLNGRHPATYNGSPARADLQHAITFEVGRDSPYSLNTAGTIPPSKLGFGFDKIYGNNIKNNLLADVCHGVSSGIASINLSYHKSWWKSTYGFECDDDPEGATPCLTYQNIVNNWDTCLGDAAPNFVDSTISAAVTETTGDTTALVMPDLNLTGTNPGILNGGIYLTTAVGAGTNSDLLEVADAKYFFDGKFGSASGIAIGRWPSSVIVQPDYICIGTVTNCAKISEVNYTTKKIRLAEIRSWSNGASVWLQKKSDGVVVLAGTAPEYGAHEYGVGSPVPDTTAPVLGADTLTATALSYSAINLNWPAFTDAVGVTGYRIYRCMGTACSPIAQVGVSSGTSYSDTNLTASTTYGYTVRAVDAALNLSLPLTTAYATTPAIVVSNTVEAESCVLVSPMVSVADSLASGGYYIHATSGSGSATCTFSVAEDGIYKIVGRVYGVSAAKDSFSVAITGIALNDAWHLNPVGDPLQYGVYYERELNAQGTGTALAPQHDPLLLTLTAGGSPYTIIFSGREANARLDYFRVEKVSVTEQYTLTYTKAGTGTGTVVINGVNCSTTCAYNFNVGTPVTITGTAGGDSTFVGWSGGLCSGTDPCSFNMTENRAVTGTFNLLPPTYKLTISKAGTGAGTIISSPTGIDYGSTSVFDFTQDIDVTLTATPISGSTFDGWSGTGGCTGTDPYVITMSADKACTATFTLSGSPAGARQTWGYDEAPVGGEQSWGTIASPVGAKHYWE